MRPAAVVLAFLLLSCSGPKAPAKTPGTGPSGPAASGAPASALFPAAPSGPPAAAVVPAPAPAPVPAVPVRPFDESLLTGREFLLEAAARPAPPVRDPVTGPAAADPTVAAAAAAFLGSAASGTPDPALLEPRWAAFLTAWAKKNGPSIGAGTVRTGEPLPEKDGVVLVPVVIRDEQRTSRGWLALARSEGGWLVSDAEVNPDTAAPTLFEPESPDQLISSPSLR